MRSTVEVGGNIVTDESLILYLDAANPESYPESGNTWYDLTLNDLDSTFPTNGAPTYPGTPTFDSSTPNSILFSGNDTGVPNYNSNSYVPFNVGNRLSTVCTFEMWSKLNDWEFDVLVGFNFYSVLIYLGVGYGFITGNGDMYGVANLNGTGLENNWVHYVFEMYPNNYSTNKIYINSVSQTLSQLLPNPNNANLTFNSGVGRLGNSVAFDIYRQPMNCSIFKIYNRELTQSEITQNFNALKSRFGIF